MEWRKGSKSGADLTAVNAKITANQNAIAAETAARVEAINQLNETLSKSLLMLSQTNGKIYGVKFPKASYSGSPLGERTEAAVGLNAGISTDTVASDNDFDNIPLFHNVMVNGYLNEDNEFIETAQEGDMRFARDGSNGDVYSRFQLSFFRYINSEDGNYEEWQVTDTYKANSGWCPFGIFVQPDGRLKKYAYIAAYEMGYNASGLCASISGVQVAHNTYINRNSYTAGLSHNSQLTEFKKKGSQYCGMTTKDAAFLQFLFTVEFATKNSQSIMQGCTNFNYQKQLTTAETEVERVIVTNADAEYYPIGCTVSIGKANGTNVDRNNASMHSIVNRKRIISKEAYDDNNTVIYIDNGGVVFDTTTDMYISTMPWHTGAADGVLGSSGSPVSNSNGYYPMMYRGIENLYGNTWTIMSDVIVSDYVPYICYDGSKYATAPNEDYDTVGYTVYKTTNQYVKDIGYDEHNPSVRLSILGGGGSTTYYCDYWYISGGTNHELVFGGFLNNGAPAGLWSWIANYAVSTAAWTCAARLSVSGRCGKVLSA